MPRFIASRLVINAAIITFLFIYFAPSHGSAAATQNELAQPAHEVPGMPVLDHAPVDCVIENVHPLFQASVQAQGGLHTVKIYFHTNDYNDFYYVEMAEAGDVWQASLPIAAPETNGFVYYIEAVDLSFNMSRTAEHMTKVTGENECARRDEGAPPIAAGSTVPGAPVVPEGFLSTGIARLITSTGATQAVRGGTGVTTGVIIAAGAAAAGIGILAGSGNDPEPEPEPPPTVAPSPGGSGGGGPDLTVNVSRSPSGTATAGSNITYIISVTYSGGTASNVTMNANLTGPITGSPSFGGFTSCGFTPTSVSCGPTDGSSFTVSITVGPISAPSNSCSASVSTASPETNSSNNSDSANATVGQRSPNTMPIELDTAFTSRLDVPPPNGSVRGQVLLNGTQLDQTDNSAPFRHHLKGQDGKNTVQARVVSGTGEGRWVFNFSGASNFVSGSLAVQSGQVISRGSDRVVFRVGPSGAPIRFRYRLSP